MNGLLIGAITVAVVLALALLWWVVAARRRRSEHRTAAARAEADRQQTAERERLEAEKVRDAMERTAREAAEDAAQEWKKEEKRRRDQLDALEKRLEDRRGTLDRKYDLLDRKEREILEREANLTTRGEELEQRAEDLESRGRELQKRLEELAGLSAEDARRRLAREQEEAARAEAANTVRELREQAKRDGEREARNIIALSIQRIAADHTAESTVSVVTLPSDEMKGRIIGREGRNIRAFEQATGIDVVIDDTPEAVILSGFDPVRREVARISLEKLIEDGRIHPGRIEEVVEDSRGDVGKAMVEAAEEVLYEIGVHGVHPEIVKVLGRLKFRTSYGQNQLLHSKEVALLAGNMAMEMGLDGDMARRMGILHDVGKGRTHEHEGTHVELGYRLCKKHGEPDQVLNAIRAHHDEEPHRYPETFLVTAADAISGARPGARREMFETYVRRLERLEEIARDFPGVERCFAIQAGREVRIMVDPEHVNDTIMSDLSERVARRLEEELQYPGQIKVVVIRETRAVDFAR